ncbi:MAG: class I SAM-dependent methyltransferase [Cytophagales bacterium]|nr:class I SAM-dependent methyltransferase [Armatimonadota bacterium]
MFPVTSLSRADLFVTTALKRAPVLQAHAQSIAEELGAAFVPRSEQGLPRLFEAHPLALRALVVQADRLLLTQRTGEELFYHPNMAYLRLGNVLRGGRDLLTEAAQLSPGDSVLDATLGYASEAILCAHVVGDSGEVHGIEAVPELGIVVREGLKTVATDQVILNAAMRRVQVMHLGHHLEFLRACPSGRYDVVCFDPFFDQMLEQSRSIAPLRIFGSLARLLPEAVTEAQRVARRRVIVKTEKWADALEAYGITERIDSRGGKVVYGILPAR